MKRTFTIIPALLVAACGLLSYCGQPGMGQTHDTYVNGTYEATLTHAPFVPPSPGYTSPKKVVVKLDVVEKVMRLADGVEYNFWTFGGQEPGIAQAETAPHPPAKGC